MDFINSKNSLLRLTKQEQNKLIHSNQALLILDKSFFTLANNIEDNRIVNNYLKQHICIIWNSTVNAKRCSYSLDADINSLPFINGQIIGLVDSSKNMSYIRNSIRSQKHILALPYIIIDENLGKYPYSGFDYEIDLQKYKINGLNNILDMIKVFNDINSFLANWYNIEYEFTDQAAAGIVVKNISKNIDYKF